MKVMGGNRKRGEFKVNLQRKAYVNMTCYIHIVLKEKNYYPMVCNYFLSK